MDPELENKLIECLEGLEAGLSLPTLLSRYPAEATQLRPMLEMAAKLAAIKVAHPVAAESASRRLFLEKAAEMRMGGRATRPGQLPLWRRLLFVLTSFLLFFVVGGTLMGGLATTALPGDWLYPVKLGLENSRLLLTRDPSERAIMEHQIEEKRLEEVYQMLATGREGRIEYTTIITQITPSEIKVHDLSVQITKETIVEGEPKAGSLVHLVCDVRSGRVFAVSMRVLSSPPPVIPTNTTTPPPILPTNSPSPTNTVTPSPILPTNTPSSTNTPSPTPSPRPTLTSTPSSTPTLSPTDDHDGDSGSSNASQTPEGTDEPDNDETPEATDEPDDDETPEATDEPDDDETPEATDEPGDDD